MPRPSSPYAAPASGQPAAQIIVFLHGYGATGEDLIGLSPFFAKYLPDAAFYSPNAPDQWEGGPFGGRQWFSLAGYDPDALRGGAGGMAKLDAFFYEGAARAAIVLNKFLDDVLAHHSLPAARLALVGFSQGTMMALHVGLRRTPAIGAIVGFSGALVGADRLAGELRARPAVKLIHGADDPVVPVEAMATIEQSLTATGVSFQSHIIPGLQHGIDPAGATLAANFLQETLA